MYATPGSDRCVVLLLDLYLSKLPPSPPALYLRPLSTSGPWYGKTRVGVNTLKNFIPNLCKESSLSVHYTNHSLRATAITRMYEHSVTEKMISDKSGHRSIKRLRAYQHTSVAEEKAAGNSINAELVNIPVVAKPQTSSDHLSKMHFAGLEKCTINFYNQ